jgi:hypothetical protein
VRPGDDVEERVMRMLEEARQEQDRRGLPLDLQMPARVETATFALG